VLSNSSQTASSLTRRASSLSTHPRRNRVPSSRSRSRRRQLSRPAYQRATGGVVRIKEEAEEASSSTGSMGVADALPEAHPLDKAGRRSCTARPFLRVLVRNTSASREVSTTSYMISFTSSIRCWSCSRTLCVLSWPPSSMPNKHINTELPRYMLTPWPKHRRKVEARTAGTDRRRSRPMSTATAPDWLSVRTPFPRASYTTILGSTTYRRTPVARRMDRGLVRRHHR
jgi:hypothetical protein